MDGEMTEAGTGSPKPTGRYVEYLRAPGKVFGALGLLLGVDSGVLTAVALRSLGDDPWLTGSAAAVFFVSFGLGVAVIVYVMLESTLMTVSVDPDSGLSVTMGVLGRQNAWSMSGVSSVRPVQHSLIRHGGRGNVFAPSSRRAWTMFGIRDGIEFEYSDDADSAPTVYFVSSRQPDSLAAALQAAGKPNAA